MQVNPFDIDKRHAPSSALRKHLLFFVSVFFDVVLYQIYSKGLKALTGLCTPGSPRGHIEQHRNVGIGSLRFLCSRRFSLFRRGGNSPC
jgi:hypothetical protein